MSIGKKPAAWTKVRGYSHTKLAPTIELIESRLMLDSGFGVIAGTAFVDAQSNDVLSANDVYLPGATIQLYQAGGATPIATQVTNSQGGYAFTGLAPGDYVVAEIPPTGDTLTGTQVLSQVEPASSIAGKRIQVTVPAGSIFLNYNGVLNNFYQVTNNLVNNTPETDSIGQLQISLGSAAGQTDINPGFLTYCIDDLNRLSFGGGEQFQIQTKPITSLTSGTPATIPADRAGRIAFLYNHFGNASLNNIQGPAIQLAIWELLYDKAPTADFSTGNFQVLGPDVPFTTQATLDQVLAQATTYFNMSAGKSESALFLDPSAFRPAGPTTGAQAMIAEASFNFANQPISPSPSSLSGSVYCDVNKNGAKDPADTAVAGALVTLTGTDQNGNVIGLTQTTDTTGAYSFTNLTPGSYTLTMYNAPGPGYIPASDTVGSQASGTVAVNKIQNINLLSGVVGTGNNFGLTGQAVSAKKLTLLGIHQQQSQIFLQFDGPLNASAASNPANYSLVGLGKDEVLGTKDDVVYSITSATYNPTYGTVTLIPNAHLNIHYHYVLRFNLPGLNSCAPNVAYSSIFGRTAVPFFYEHGKTLPNPPLTPAEIRHDNAVVQNTLAQLKKYPTLR